jgi:hypothetical protein
MFLHYTDYAGLDNSVKNEELVYPCEVGSTVHSTSIKQKSACDKFTGWFYPVSVWSIQ